MRSALYSMSRLIEIQDIDGLPPTLELQVGDMLWFAASGGRVRSNDKLESDAVDVVQMFGAFLPGVIGTNGQILSPMGSPNTVLFLTRRTGWAIIDIITGDPFHQTRTVSLNIMVEP